MDDIGDIAHGVISGIAGEAKKIGQSAISQMTGGVPVTAGSFKSSKPLAANEVGGHPFSLFGELKQLGQSAIGQVSGQVLTAAEVAAMDKKDKQFSKEGTAEVRARIAQIYQENEARRKRQEQERQQQLGAQEEQKREQEEIDKQKKQMPINPMVERAKAEIKNYGAE